MSKVRVGVWGVFGHGNYGNEATLTAFLGRLDPGRHEPIILTEDPIPAAESHGVPARLVGAPHARYSGGRVSRAIGAALNRGRYLAAAIRLAGHLDGVVMAGTGGLERAGPFGTPFEMWSLAVAARLRRRPVLLLDVGVERGEHPLARFFARGVARAATYRSYRDEWSRENMAANGFRAAVDDPVVTDMAFALEPKWASDRDINRVVIGVIETGEGGDDARSSHERYISRCARLIADLHAAGRSVVLVVGDDADRATASDLIGRLGQLPIPLSPAKSPEELTMLMSGASAVVASRYHTLIMSLIAETPVVSIGYSRKHLEMLRQFGLSETHRDIDDFDPTEVAALVEVAIADQDSIRTLIADGLRAARARLDAHWPDVMAALDGSSKGVR